MTKAIHRAALVVLLVGAGIWVGALSACKDDSAGPIGFDGFCDDLTLMACTTAQRCDCLGGYSVDLCVMYARPDCADGVEAPVNEGRRRYDARAAGQCLDALTAIIADCSTEGADWPASCDAMLVGIRQEGQACEDDADCIGTLECWSSTCIRLPTAGQPCHDGSACVQRHYCDPDTVCQPYVLQGGSCAQYEYACDDDLYCDVRDETCQPYLQQGASCTHDEYACDDDLYCSPGSGTCLPYPSAGQSCLDSGGSCADDHFCDPVDECQPQRPAGVACAEDRECLSWDCPVDVCVADTDDICGDLFSFDWP